MREGEDPLIPLWALIFPDYENDKQIIMTGNEKIHVDREEPICHKDLVNQTAVKAW
jgi:hypothetical protein